MCCFVGSSKISSMPSYLQKLVDVRCRAVEVLCFVGIQGYSQGADLTARGGGGVCRVYLGNCQYPARPDPDCDTPMILDND